jgi:hypothetical protein
MELNRGTPADARSIRQRKSGMAEMEMSTDNQERRTVRPNRKSPLPARLFRNFRAQRLAAIWSAQA